MPAHKSTKRGQVQLSETFLVLFIVIILLFLGLFFYAKFFTRSLQEQADTLTTRETTVLLAKITSLAEARCSDKPCLDTSKFLPFQTLTQQQRTAYRALFGNQKITVEELYPIPISTSACTKSLYLQTTYPGNCSRWTFYDQKPATVTSTQKVSTIVSLYYPEDDSYTLGRLTLEVYR